MTAPSHESAKSWHYRRTCSGCGTVWYSLHCPHDGVQGRCPSCKLRPVAIIVECSCRFDPYPTEGTTDA